MNKVKLLGEVQIHGQLMDFHCIYNSKLTGKNFAKYTVVDGLFKPFSVYKYFKTEEGLARFHGILNRIEFFIVEVVVVEYLRHGLIYRLQKSLKPVNEVSFRRVYGIPNKRPLKRIKGKNYIEGYVPITVSNPATTEFEAEIQHAQFGMYVPPQNFWTPKYRETLEKLGILEIAERIVITLDFLGDDW